MDQTIFDVVESEFGTPLGPDLIAAVEQAPHDRLLDLQERAKAFGRGATVPAKGAGHLRPYVPLERHRGPEVAHGLNLRPGDFKHPERIDAALNALKHHLLYCHSLAIDDPLRWLLDMFVIGPEFEASKEASRPLIVNCLRFLHQIEPFVRADVIVLVEHDVEHPVTQFGLLRDEDAVVETADFSDVPVKERQLLETQGELARRVLVSHANHEVAIGLEAAAKHAGNLDLYLPYRHFEDVLRAAAETTPDRIPEWPREVELLVVEDILNVSLPGLAELTWADIVAIRKNEEAFARWRASLESVLERVGALDAQTLSRETEEARILEQELLDIQAGISKSAFLSRAQTRLKFAIGGLVARPVTPNMDPLGPLIGDAGKAGVSLLLDFLGGQRDRESARALHKQYLLFSPGDGR